MRQVAEIDRGPYASLGRFSVRQIDLMVLANGGRSTGRGMVPIPFKGRKRN